MELVTQISAMIGTSLVLYLATTPRGDDLSDYYVDDDRPRLKGAKKYSSYHRKKLYRELSKVSDMSGSISDTSSVSSSASISVSSSFSR